MKGQYLEHLNWLQAEQALKDSPCVVLPIGARCKEHGPHLPLNTDWLQAEYFTREVLKALPVIALPTLQYGYYPAFVDYPGSTHLQDDTFLAVLLDVCRSVTRHGVTRIYALNTGISTMVTLTEVKEQLTQDGLHFCFSNPATLVRELEADMEQQPYGSHADELETSVMLAIAPELVDMDKAPADLNLYQGRGPFNRHDPTAPGLYSPSGIWGDATLASQDKGERLVEAMSAQLIEDIQAFYA